MNYIFPIIKRVIYSGMTIQVRHKPNPLRLYTGSDKQIKGIRFDRVPEELWTEVHDIVQEPVIKTISKKKKCKKAKWLSDDTLQTAEKEEKLKAKEKRKDISI